MPMLRTLTPCIPVSMRRTGSVGGRACESAGVAIDTNTLIVAVTNQPKLMRFMLSPLCVRTAITFQVLPLHKCGVNRKHSKEIYSQIYDS